VEVIVDPDRVPLSGIGGLSDRRHRLELGDRIGFPTMSIFQPCGTKTPNRTTMVSLPRLRAAHDRCCAAQRHEPNGATWRGAAGRASRAGPGMDRARARRSIPARGSPITAGDRRPIIAKVLPISAGSRAACLVRGYAEHAQARVGPQTALPSTLRRMDTRELTAAPHCSASGHPRCRLLTQARAAASLCPQSEEVTATTRTSTRRERDREPRLLRSGSGNAGEQDLRAAPRTPGRRIRGGSSQ
jgi:hypothetical protein